MIPAVDAGLAEHPLDVLADGLDQPLGEPGGLGEVRLLPQLEDLVLVAEDEGPGDRVRGRVREGQVHAQRPHDVLGQLLDVHAGREPLDDAGRLVDEGVVGRALAPLVEAAERGVQPGSKRPAGGPELDRGALGVGEVGAPRRVDLRLLGLPDLADGAGIDLRLARRPNSFALADDHLLRGRELDDRASLALLRAHQLARGPARGRLATGVHRADEVEVRGVRRAPDERDPLGAVVADGRRALERRGRARGQVVRDAAVLLRRGADHHLADRRLVGLHGRADVLGLGRDRLDHGGPEPAVDRGEQRRLDAGPLLEQLHAPGPRLVVDARSARR